MSALHRASLGFLRRHPWQLGLALLGICIGVAVMVAVDLANDSSRKALVASMDAVNGETTHQIIGGPGGLRESIYVDLRVTHGIRHIAPVVAGNVRINGTTMQLLGVDLFAESEFRSFSSPGRMSSDRGAIGETSGIDLARRLLTDAPGLSLPSSAAQRFGFESGDVVELKANGRTYPAIVQAVIATDGRDELSNLVIADIAVAQHWLGMQGSLTRIDVKIDAQDEVAAQTIANALPPGVELLSAAGRTQTTAAMSDAFMINLKAMSLLAMLVGVFLIYNSVAFAVLQRRDLIGILRALGVTRQRVFGLILVEAALLGMAGSALGVTAGVLLGEQLLGMVARTISDHYFVVNVTDVAVSTLSVAKGMIAGLLVTLVAAAVPAFEASSVQPRLAMTRSVIERRAGRITPLLFFAGVLLVVAAVILLIQSGDNLVAGLLALFMLILGFALCIPTAVQKLSMLLEPLAGRLGGVAGRLAIGSVGRTLSRTGVAIVALSIAVSATIGVSVMVESFRGSVSDWLDTTLQSDVYVGVPRGAINPDLITDVVAVPGIAGFSTSRRSWLESGTGRTRIIALSMAPGSYAGTRLRGGDPALAWQQFDQEDGILVSDAYAYRLDMSAGDSVELNTTLGPVQFRIAAVYQSYDSNDGAIMMSRRTYDRYFDDPAVDSLGLYLHAGTSTETVIASIREISDGRQDLIMSSNARIREISMSIFDRTFVITNVLYWLAVGVAIIGILGAMLALQLERAKEFGVLRALGMTPLQTGLLVTGQSGYIGLLSGLAALPLGLVMAWVLLEVINRRAFGWQIDFSLQPQVLGWATLLAVAAALVAGLYPALHAARTRPALAMREE